MPSAQDIFNKLVELGDKLDTLNATSQSIKTDDDQLLNVASTDLGELITAATYTNQALYQNALQNATIICLLEQISKNTCDLVNLATVQTRLQESIEKNTMRMAAMLRPRTRRLRLRWSGSRPCAATLKNVVRRNRRLRRASRSLARRRSRSIRRRKSVLSSDDVLIEPVLLAALVIAADRSSKVAVCTLLGSGRVVPIGAGLRIRYVVTRFQRRGLLRSPTALLLLWTAALGVVLLATGSGHFFQRPVAQMGLGAALAGVAATCTIAFDTALSSIFWIWAGGQHATSPILPSSWG